MMITNMRDNVGGSSTSCCWLLLRRVFLMGICCLLLVPSVLHTVQAQDSNATTNVTSSTTGVPTTAPTPSLSAQLCEDLQPGDVFIFVVESNGPVGTIIGFLALTQLPAGLILHLTDYPWNGTNFLTTEEESGESDVQFMVSEEGGGIEPLQRFGFGNFSFIEQWTDSQNETALGILDLNHTQGDSLFLYCYLMDGSIRHLVGYSNAGSWAEPGLTLEEYNLSFSALPTQLENVGSIVLPHLDNYEYIGSNVGRKQQLQEFMRNASNWNGTDDSFFDVDTITVVVGNTTIVTWTTNPDALDGVIVEVTPPPVPVRPNTTTVAPEPEVIDTTSAAGSVYNGRTTSWLWWCILVYLNVVLMCLGLLHGWM